MASRPIFLPVSSKTSPTREVLIDFKWYAGMAVSQKQKSIAALHAAAVERLGIRRILEVSTKSPVELGKRLSAFNLRVPLKDGSFISVESAYQGSKVFSNGGPYTDLLKVDSREAKTDMRLKTSGALKSFQFEGEEWGLEPPTAFYDWLYLSALAADSDLMDLVAEYDGFTDIEFNPERSINCQARSVALLCSLKNLGDLRSTLQSRQNFLKAVSGRPHGVDQGRLF